MSINDAMRHLTRQSGEPESGWLTPDRIRAAVAQIYDDLARAEAIKVEERIVIAPPIGRSSAVSMLPQIVPEDGWVTIEHGLHSTDVIVQASTHGMVVPLGIRVLGADSIAVHTDVSVHEPVKIVVIR